MAFPRLIRKFGYDPAGVCREHKIKREKPPRSHFAIARMPFCGTQHSPDTDASMEFWWRQ